MYLKHQGIQKYNTDVKFCGNNVSIKLYDDYQLKGYKVKEVGSFDGGFPSRREDLERIYNDFYSEQIKIKARLKLEELEVLKKERWVRSNRRAKQRVMDLVACNANKWLDPNGNKEMTKFITLTFKEDNENTRDLQWCNNELSKWMKRVSYHVYGAKKNVLKYISVPELQKRGVWHFHIILFNLKYVKHSKLLNLWGGKGYGSVNVKAIKADSEGMVSRYVVKYMTDGIGAEDKKDKSEDRAEYEKYLELGLEDTRRYNPARGLNQPLKLSYNAQKDELEEVTKFLAVGGYLEQLSDDESNVVDYHVVESQERGTITYINFTIKDKEILKNFKKNMFKTALDRRTIWQEKFDMEKNRRIIEKIRYSIAYRPSRIKNIEDYMNGDEKIIRRSHEKIIGYNYITQDIITKLG